MVVENLTDEQREEFEVELYSPPPGLRGADGAPVWWDEEQAGLDALALIEGSS